MKFSSVMQLADVRGVTDPSYPYHGRAREARPQNSSTQKKLNQLTIQHSLTLYEHSWSRDS